MTPLARERLDLMAITFTDRAEAGRELATSLTRFAGHDQPIVLALPRGGLPVAAEVAAHLHSPLDVMVVRKLGVPGHEELAMGAIASGGIRVLNDHVVRGLGITAEAIDRVAMHEAHELARREKLYRGDRPYPSLSNRCVILVDDGLATGSTMSAAIAAARQHGAKTIVVAVPVGSPSAVHLLSSQADKVVCLAAPVGFRAVSEFYENFGQTTDHEVRSILDAAERSPASG